MLSDRLDRLKVLLWARLLSTVAAALPAILLVTNGIDRFGGPPVLLLCTVLMGIGVALSSPSMQSVIPGLVRPKDLERALVLNAVSPSLGRTIGPALGAALLLAGGPALAFAAAALSHFVFVGTLLITPSPRQERSRGRVRLWGGFAYMFRENAHLAILLSAVGLLSIGADPVITLTPALAAEMHGGTALAASFVLWYGIGAVINTLAFGQLRRLLSLTGSSVAGFCFLAVGLIVSSLAKESFWVCFGFFVGGWGFMTANVALTTRVQQVVPDVLRGRVMAIWGIAFLGARPIAAAVNGWMAEVLSTTGSMAIAGLITLASGVLAGHRYRDKRT